MMDDTIHYNNANLNENILKTRQKEIFTHFCSKWDFSN